MAPPCRILYVDDNKDSCELVRAMVRFSDLNYEISCAPTAENAISLMSNQTFDLYMLDYSLPEMSGVELCRLIRKADAITPIMFLSAKAFPAEREEALNAGANDYLIKPNDLERLVEAVSRLLDENPLAECETPNKAKAHNDIY